MVEHRTQIPWLRIGAEGVVIIASILFAFAIDAWWEERQDREIEREDLERLHAEFIWNRDRIDDFPSPAIIQTASQDMYKLVSAHLGSHEKLEVPNDLLNDIRGTPTFDVVTPVLDGLILSGRLSNIRDRDVLSTIALWQRWVTQVGETDLAARQYTQSLLLPALMKRGNIGPSYTEPDGTTLITVDDELVGMIARRANQSDRILRQHGSLRSSANDVVLAVEKALGE